MCDMSARVGFLDSTTEQNTTEIVVRRVLFPMGLKGKDIMTISFFSSEGCLYHTANQTSYKVKIFNSGKYKKCHIQHFLFFLSFNVCLSEDI